MFFHTNDLPKTVIFRFIIFSSIIENELDVDVREFILNIIIIFFYLKYNKKEI